MSTHGRQSIFVKVPETNFPQRLRTITNIDNFSNNVGNQGPINLWKDGGRSPINGYNPFIIRTPNNVKVPRDITTVDDKTGAKETMSCEWPSWSGGQFQEWTNEKVAMYEYQMRPIMEPKYYNQILMKMFNLIVYNSTGLDNTQDIPYGTADYGAVSCGSGTSPDDIMKILMGHVANAVAEMPEMHRNGSYNTEQFHYTDPDMYKFMGPEDEIYYQILFNLYNPLRSVSTYVYATIQVNDNKVFIYRLSFVNNKLWTTTEDMPDVDSNGTRIENFNLGPVGNRTISAVPHTLEPGVNTMPWLYANTLLDQQFNKYGFYDNIGGVNNNIEITKIGVPDSLKQRISNVQKYSNTYLFEPATVAYNGIVPNGIGEPDVPPGSKRQTMYKLSENNGRPKTVLKNPSVIYGPQLHLEQKENENGTIRLTPSVANLQKPPAIGFIRV